MRTRSQRLGNTRGKINRTVLLLLCIPPAMLLFLLSVLGVVAMSANKKIVDGEAKIRTKGFPTTLEELNTWYEAVPDDENVAVLAIPLLKKLGDSGLKDSIMDRASLLKKEWTPGKPFSLQDFAEITEYLDEFERTYVPGIAEALARKRCRYPLDLGEGVCVTLPHLAPTRDACRILGLLFRQSMLKGEYERGLEYLRLSLDLADALKNEPELISQLVRVADIANAVQAIQEVLNSTTVPDLWLLALNNLLQGREYPEAGLRGIHGEFCQVLGGIDMILGIRPTTDPEIRKAAKEVQRFPRPLRTTWKRSQVYGAYAMISPFLDLYGKPWSEWIARDNELDPLYRPVIRHIAIDPQYMSGTLPAVIRAAGTFARGEAQLRCARLAIGVLRYNSIHGKFPGALDEMADEYSSKDRTDPFDGNHLRYAQVPDGFVVYSVGHNLVDDGGQDLKKDSASSKILGDVPFRVTTPR